MVGKRGLSVKDPLYQKIIKMGPGIAPDLQRIAKNRDIQWHYIAYWMLGQIHDRASIPYLMDALNAEEDMIRLHAVRGLNCLLGKGMYNPGADDADEIESRYKRWWERHKAEFPRQPAQTPVPK